MKPYLFLFLVIAACSSARLPQQKLSQCTLSHNYYFTENHVHIKINNPLHCPLRTWVNIQDDTLKEAYKDNWPIVLPPLSDTTFSIPISHTNFFIKFASLFGDTNTPITPGFIDLPFKKGKSYKLVQGYNSTPSHNTAYSRYALDFGLPVGDTICAATDGYVIGVVDGYTDGGDNKNWRPYANFITIYQPESGLFFQYVHLMHKGAFVKNGDYVSAQQPIGLSGVTGYTTTPHLHFNILVPVHTKEGMQSFEIDSIGNYTINNLKRGQFVKNGIFIESPSQNN